MSVYHNSFTYLGKNSKDDFGLIITHFDDNADSGEMDTFLSTSAIYSDSYDGTRQRFYGAKYDTVATPQITVVKHDGTDFGVEDNRQILRWLTGSRQATWMDFYVGDEVKYRLLGRVKSVSQYKMDARVIGFVLTFESISPYGYLNLYSVSSRINGEAKITISCESDDLYSYVYMNTTYTNTSGSSLTISNDTIDETTIVTGLVVNEVVTMSDNMVITSDKPAKTFGNTFNFVFPRLVPGDNEFTINGHGNITFQYTPPVKLGDIAVDINAVSDPICDSEGNIQIDMLDWNRISNTPTTAGGYGITDVYTISSVYNKNEINKKLKDVSDEAKSAASLASSLSTRINNEYYDSGYIDDNYYNKTEIDEIISSIEPQAPGGGSEPISSVHWSQITGKPTTLDDYRIKIEVENMIAAAIRTVEVDIDENELNEMLEEILI